MPPKSPAKPRKAKVPKVGALRKTVSGVRSVAIEEEVPVNFHIVGTREWIEGWFYPEALDAAARVIPVCDPSDLAEVLTYLDPRPVHALDSETGQDVHTRPEASAFDKDYGMEPWMPTSQMLMAQYGDRERQYIIEPRLMKHFRPLLTSDRWLKILQNSGFDFKFFLGKYGIHLVNIYDTMLREQQLTAGLNGLRVGLLELARRYSPHRIIRKDVRDEFVKFRIGVDRFTRDMTVYGARDVVLPFDIRDGQLEQIERWKLHEVGDLEDLTVMCTAEMEHGGVPMDGAVLGLAMTYFEERDHYLIREIQRSIGRSLAEKQDHIFGLFGQDGFEFDVRSGPERLRMFRDELGFDINDVTRETMAGIPHEAGVLIAEWTNVDKYRSTYGQAMIDRICPYDGRYHPRFSQLGLGDNQGGSANGKDSAATGRYSSNFQQLPQPAYRMAKVNDLGEVSLVERRFAEQIRSIRTEREIPQSPL